MVQPNAQNMSSTATPSAKPLCQWQESRMVPLLVLSLVGLIITFTTLQLRTGCVVADSGNNGSSRVAARARHHRLQITDNSSSAESKQPAATGGYMNVTEHPVCGFFRTGYGQSHETMWGRHSLCDLDEPGMWLQRALSNCYSCLEPSRNVCRQPRLLTYNQYLVGLHPLAWQANLLSLQAFLMTQDLRRARMVLWADDPAAVYTNNTAPFFDTFSEFITVKQFNYSEEVVGTPWEGDAFFGNASLVRSYMPHAGSWSDVVRIMLLHKYGDFWMDNDVVLYRDVSHLLAISYQFVTRWTNLHVMRMDAGSALSQRVMQTALQLPLNHAHFEQEVLDKICKPNGYSPAHHKYKNTDIYNTCLFRMLIRNNNTGQPDAVLYDLPLGWWDHDWSGCFDSRQSINDTHWRKMAGNTLAMHNRHPGSDLTSVNPLGPEEPPSPLRRVIKIIEDFFKQCSSRDCLPLDGMPLLAYESMGATV